MSTNPVLLRKHGTKAIELAEGSATAPVQILKAGVFAHPFYGLMRITPQVLQEMVQNFDQDVRRQRLPIDYFHESDGMAAGWFTRIYTLADGNELWGDAEFTPKAQQMLRDKEVAYFSADFYFEWEDPETGTVYKNVLNGGGLVNRPFIKGMKPVAELAEVNEGDLHSMKTAEQLNGEITQLSEKVKATEGEVATLKAQLSEKDAEISRLKGEKAQMAADKEKSDKLAKFHELCREGKAVAAQQEAFLAGDMVKFAELSKAANTVPAGNGGEGGAKGADGKYVLSESDKEYCRQTGLSEEDFAKYNA